MMIVKMEMTVKVLAQGGEEGGECEEEKGEQASLRRSSQRKGIVPTNMSNTAAQIVLFLSRIGAIKPKSCPIKTLYYYNKRLKGCGEYCSRAMYNAWPHVEEAACERNLTNKDSELFKKLVLGYNDCIP